MDYDNRQNSLPSIIIMQQGFFDESKQIIEKKSSALELDKNSIFNENGNITEDFKQSLRAHNLQALDNSKGAADQSISSDAERGVDSLASQINDKEKEIGILRSKQEQRRNSLELLNKAKEQYENICTKYGMEQTQIRANNAGLTAEELSSGAGGGGPPSNEQLELDIARRIRSSSIVSIKNNNSGATTRPPPTPPGKGKGRSSGAAAEI